MIRLRLGALTMLLWRYGVIDIQAMIAMCRQCGVAKGFHYVTRLGERKAQRHATIWLHAHDCGIESIRADLERLQAADEIRLERGEPS